MPEGVGRSGRSIYNILMKRTLSIIGLGLLCAVPAAAQLGPPQKLTPTKFCTSSDTSLECVSQRNQANIDRYSAEYKDRVRKDAEHLKAEQQERDRQRTVQQKDCNPRVRRCD